MSDHATDTPLEREFANTRQWVNYRKELRDGKETKVPYQPDGRKAASDDPGTWRPLATVKAAAHRFDGIGLVFGPDKKQLGIDLDHVLTNGGEIKPELQHVADFVTLAETYAEYSPSNDGVHVWFKLTNPLDLERKRQSFGGWGVECYTTERYFTVTGRRYEQCADVVRTVTPDEAIALLGLLGYPWPKAATSKNGDRVEVIEPAVSSTPTDDELRERMFASKHGADIRRLWDGDTSAYQGDDSKADAALCAHLAWWTNGNATRMEALWLSSPLGSRSKTQDRADYRKRTIDGALATVSGGYDPAKAHASEQQKRDEDKPTDDELADRWLRAHPQTLYGMGAWRRYSSGWWSEADQADIERELLGTIKAAKVEGIRPTAGKVESVSRIARITVSRKPDAWDADTDVLVCANGTLHIPSMTLREWRPGDLATSAVPYNYDPAATCPAFLRVVNEAVPHAHDLIQEFYGYALTTDTRHELALWLYGPGGSGKSSVIEGGHAMLGDRVLDLGLADIERSRFALGRLPGKTLAISTEQPGGLLKAAEMINKIISGESLTVEMKFRDPVTIRPRAKVLWAMNELPRVSDPNNGLFRRVKVIEFPPLPESKRDPEIKEAIKREGAGILNWSLIGLHRLRERGRFDVPASVTQATEHFRQNSDIPALFVEEMCFTGDDYRAQSSKLYDQYAIWAKRNGHKPQSSTTLAEDWRRLGFIRREIGGRSHWVGVGLRVVEDVPTPPPAYAEGWD